jgi:hypothetical protein
LRAVENASLLMTSIRMKTFLHTSPFFLIQGNNQDSRICCFHKIFYGTYDVIDTIYCSNHRLCLSV